MPRIVSRTIVGMSAYPEVVTSPAMCTWPVVIMVSTATREAGSSLSSASRMESEIWSAILSGCPSVTDSEVNRRRAVSGRTTGRLLLAAAADLMAGAIGPARVHAPVYPCTPGAWVPPEVGYRGRVLSGRLRRLRSWRRSYRTRCAQNSCASFHGGRPRPGLESASALCDAAAAQSRDPVPDGVGEGALGTERDLGLHAVRADDDALGDLLAEDLVRADLVDHEQVHAVRGHLAAAEVEEGVALVAGLRGEAHHGLARREPVAAMTVTSAPRATAAAASAYPCRPEERLPRYRTGSRGSRVPPAEMTTRSPSRSSGSDPPRRSTATAASKISAGSGSRPGPESAPVSRPTAGSSTIAPRRRSVATFSRVAGCSHISVCIAGANTTGQRAVSNVLVSRSSARPWAAFASRSAVAGATSTRSADWPRRTCGTSETRSQTSVETGCPDSASQ